ncbi:stage II sporulation protein M [Tepidibacillus fermentans]|uniref:Stage II sporulation protein M n=1 Tax=Tepidibacillus fermentans TaxID=1281767 RepID=A0A4R3KK43_9BACI|nr:stage II sporulation protein M [Tepidibacillus fermentans]TCS84074.1 stage II sporulation protein M [Tepidibacillus fermentans]
MRRRPINDKIGNYVKQHFSLYIFTIILFIMGVIYGSLIIQSLSSNQKQEMIGYLSQFFHGLTSNGDAVFSTKVALKQVIFEHLKYLGMIWFLGLSIIGMPLILILIFMKGFVIGFTVSFLISQLQWKGFVFSFVSILPQNLLIVPAYIIASVAGIAFSLSLVLSRIKRNPYTPFIHQPFLSFFSLIMMMAAILVVASGFETFVSPYLMRSMANLFY